MKPRILFLLTAMLLACSICQSQPKLKTANAKETIKQIGDKSYQGLKPGDIAPDAVQIDADGFSKIINGAVIVAKGNKYGLVDMAGNFLVPYGRYEFLTRNLMIKLPDYSFNGPGMAPFARDIENFFYKLCRIVLTEPSPNLYVSRIRWAGEILKDLQITGVDTSKISAKSFLKSCNSLEIPETEGLTFLAKSFDKVFEFLKTRIEIYPMLINDYNSFFESSEHRIERLKKEGNEFISTTENFKKVFKQRDGITVSTMHSVKGLEFDTVIAFGLLEDYVPHFSDSDGANSARKLIYVIASRAKLNLHLISERRKKSFSKPPRNMFSTAQLADYAFIYDEC